MVMAQIVWASSDWHILISGFCLCDPDCHIQISFDYMMLAMSDPLGLGLLLYVLFSLVFMKSSQWFLSIFHSDLGELGFTIFRYLFLRHEVCACMAGKETVKELKVSFHLVF